MVCITSGSDPGEGHGISAMPGAGLGEKPRRGPTLLWLGWLFAAGALLTAAGIFAWVATVAGWISVDIGVQLQSLALAGMVLLTSILALYLLALRGGRWRRIIKWGCRAAALLTAVWVLPLFAAAAVWMSLSTGGQIVLVLLPVMGPQLIFLALYLLTLHAERRRWIIEWGLRAGTLLTAAGIFAWVATVAVWISLGIGQIVLVLLPVMGLQLIFLALYLLTLHAERRRWIIEWGLRAGTLLTAAGIFAWVATVAVWISLGIGVWLQYLALAGMVLLTSILALYSLALRGGRWSGITEWVLTAGALLVAVAILINDASAVISDVLLLLGVLLITSALLAELLAAATRPLNGDGWQWPVQLRWVLYGALLLGVAGLVLPGTIGNTVYGLAFLILAPLGLIWFLKNGIRAVRRPAQRRNFVRVLAVFFASAVAVEAFWILAPLVLVFLAGSGSVLVWRNESLPMTRATTVLVPAIFFLHTSPAWLSKSSPWDKEHEKVNRHLQAAHAAGAALFTCFFIFMLRMRGAPLAKLGLEAAIFASVGVLTLLTPVYRWIVQTVWQNGSWMIFSANYRSTECKEWGPVLQAVREAMKKQDISKTNAKSERTTSSDPQQDQSCPPPPRVGQWPHRFPPLGPGGGARLSHASPLDDFATLLASGPPAQRVACRRRALEKERRESSHRQGGTKGRTVHEQ